MNGSDSIVAQATASGSGAIAIVRMSGSEVGRAIEAIFRPTRATWPRIRQDRRFHLGEVVGPSGLVIDTGLIVFHQGPQSYTGEDVAEVHVHGSQAVVDAVIALAIQSGLRMARPGEFTRRAFIKGKIELTQAEGVMALISADSEAAAAAAHQALSGAVGRRLLAVRTCVLECLKWLEMAIDFPEEAEGVGNDDEMALRLRQLRSLIDELVVGCGVGDMLRLGFKAVLCGPPNAGKSSLFNRLLGDDRALVTAVPGTTRDVLQAQMVLDGRRVQLHDTAGIRETADEVEMLGVQRAMAALNDANLKIFVLDGANSRSGLDPGLLVSMRYDTDVVVLNKADRGICSELRQLSAGLLAPVFEVSASTGAGVGMVRDAILEGVRTRERASGSPIVVSAWQKEVLEAIQADVALAEDALSIGQSNEVVAFNLYEILGKLDRVLGKDSKADLLDLIFRDFCLGK